MVEPTSLVTTGITSAAKIALRKVLRKRVRLEFVPHESMRSLEPFSPGYEARIRIINPLPLTAEFVRASVSIKKYGEADWQTVAIGRRTEWPLFIQTPRGIVEQANIPWTREKDEFEIIVLWTSNPPRIRVLNTWDYTVSGDTIVHKHMTMPTTDLAPGRYLLNIRLQGPDCKAAIILDVQWRAGEEIRVTQATTQPS